MISNTELYRVITQKEHHTMRRSVDWKLAETYSSKNLPPVERMTDRFERMCAQERPVILEGERIALLRTVSNLPELFTQAEWNEIRRTKYIHELGYWSNLSPNYYAVIATGLLARRENADSYGKRVIDSIIDLTDRYREEAQRLGRDDIAAVLEQVPRYPARNFLEALQFFRILHFALWLEGDYHNTIGRFDRYMWPYLKRDMEQGLYSRESALELVEEFFLSFNRDSDLYPGVQQGDNGQSMMLGGIDEEGNDVFNLLSELALEASRNNRLIDPKINLRVGKDTPPERYTLATELTKVGLGFPQYSNDDVVIPALEKLGYSHADASNYTVAACWEFIIPFVGTDIPNIGAMSFPAAVDRAFRSCLMTCDTYEAFFEAVKQEIVSDCDKICDSIRDLWIVPSPFMNLLMDCGCNQGGKYNNFGIHGTGLSTAADSLAAIRQYVYEEKTITPQAYLQAVEDNYIHAPQLLHQLRYEAPKLGNGLESVDGIATDLLDAFAEALQGRVNCCGGIYRAGTGSAMYYLWHARELGASPDGRRAGESFAANYSVSLFARVKGPVSVIRSMTRQNFSRVINGGPLTLEFHNSVFSEPDGVRKVGALVRSFILHGGHQLQLNTVDPAAMRDAQLHPERYRQLVVRIWGWSAYFVELDKEYQDHVIARQEYIL